MITVNCISKRPSEMNIHKHQTCLVASPHSKHTLSLRIFVYVTVDAIVLAWSVRRLSPFQCRMSINKIENKSNDTCTCECPCVHLLRRIRERRFAHSNENHFWHASFGSTHIQAHANVYFNELLCVRIHSSHWTR